jgi:hypothetical protein
MRLHRRQNQPIAGYRAEFRSCDLLHGVDQHRQPQLLAIGRPSPNSPYLKLLTHHACSCLPADPVINPQTTDWFPKLLAPYGATACRKESRPDVIHFTKAPISLA